MGAEIRSDAMRASPEARGSADSKISAYRPDIDGLRAIAVLSVIVFHFSKDWLPGGFLGVDVFFVISGYLITSIIVREATAGSYSIAKFYERRVRRIAPALITLLATTTLVSAVLLLPLDMVGYGKSLLATLGFVSNVYFWRDANYFAAAAETKPLLHTWTLGVEEQFYILFPLLVALLARRPRALLYGVVLVIAVVSLVGNIVALRIGAALPAFYLLPTRAWELGAGALLAMTPARMIAPRLAGIAAVAGLTLIAFALTWGPAALPEIVPVALPAVAGTVLLIWTGGCAATSVARILSLRSAVAVGLISYSLYLWHWPIIVLYRYYRVEEPGPVGVLLMLAAMFGLAAFSWRYIERPFREKRVTRRRVYAFAAGGAAILALAGLAMIAGKGFPGRLNPAAARLNAAISTNFHCPIADMVNFGAGYGCMLGSGEPQDADVILLGNSHAQMYGPLVAQIAEARGLETLLIPANGCAPLAGVNISRNCIRIAERNIEATAGQRRSQVVVIAFAWHVRDRLVDREGNRPADDRQAMIDGLDATIDRLRASGKKVVLVGPVQIPDYEFASVMSRAVAFGRDPDRPTSVPMTTFLAEMGPYIDHFAARDDIAFVAPHRTQCAGGSCAFMIDGDSLFADTNHLASGALRYFAPEFERGMGQALDSRDGDS